MAAGATPFNKRLQADGTYISSMPAHAIGADIAEGASGLFTFATPVTLARVVKAYGVTARFRIAINQDEAVVDQSDASENVWEEDLGATDRRVTISDVKTSKLAIHSDAAVVYGDDFVVFGFV